MKCSDGKIKGLVLQAAPHDQMSRQRFVCGLLFTSLIFLCNSSELFAKQASSGGESQCLKELRSSMFSGPTQGARRQRGFVDDSVVSAGDVPWTVSGGVSIHRGKHVHSLDPDGGHPVRDFYCRWRPKAQVLRDKVQNRDRRREHLSGSAHQSSCAPGTSKSKGPQAQSNTEKYFIVFLTIFAIHNKRVRLRITIFKGRKYVGHVRVHTNIGQ